MGVFQKKSRANGLQVYTYLDDVLLIGRSKSLVQKQLDLMLEDLTTAGMAINTKKSVLTPSQMVTHLGFTIDLKKRGFVSASGKLKSVKRELGKLLTHPSLSCRKLAAILGQVKSFLTALLFLSSGRRESTSKIQICCNQSA